MPSIRSLPYHPLSAVIPAKAGIHFLGRAKSKMDSRFRGNDDTLEDVALTTNLRLRQLNAQRLDQLATRHLKLILAPQILHRHHALGQLILA
jgi:hypothetical protein